MDSNKMAGEEARRQLHKNAASKSWRQHPTRHQLYSHLPPITKIIQDRDPDMQDTAGEAGTNS